MPSPLLGPKRAIPKRAVPRRAAATIPKLGLVPLIAATFFMVSGGPYGIEDIVGGAGYFGGLLLLLCLPFIWSLPTALMLGELGSMLPEEGGFYIWVRRAMGPFWGFQEAWLSLTASIFDMAIYPTLFVLYLGRLYPPLTAGHLGLLWSLGVVVLCCLLNLLGANFVGEGSTLLMVLLLLPFAVLTVAGVWRAMHGGAHGSHASLHTPVSDLATAFLVALWNYMGWDNASTVAGEVNDAQRTYPRAMLAAVLLVALSYLLPVGALALAGVSPAAFSTGSWVTAARELVGPWLGLAVVAGGMVNGFGMFNALVLSYTRLPMVLAEDGYLPSALTRRNRKNVPWVAVLVCGCAWALALGFSFERLITIDLVLYGGGLVLEFIALLVLRRKEPALPRPFRIPGGFGVAVLASALPTAMVAVAIYLARGDRLAGMSALSVSALIALAGPAVFWIARASSARRRGLTAPW
ncbi:MAG: APC family permease [Acidobacteriaceae bacterium]